MDDKDGLMNSAAICIVVAMIGTDEEKNKLSKSVAPMIHTGIPEKYWEPAQELLNSMTFKQEEKG